MRKIQIQRAVLPLLIDMIKPERLQLKPFLARARVAFVRMLVASFTEHEREYQQVIMDFIPKEGDTPQWFEGVQGRFAPDIQLADDPQLLADCKVEMGKIVSQMYVLEEKDNELLFERLTQIFTDLDIDFKVDVVTNEHGHETRIPREELIYTDICQQLDIGL